MIKVVAKMTIQEGTLERFISNIQELVSETRKEAGCIVYQLFQDVNDKNLLTFIEEWESNEALEKHMVSRHFKETMPKLAEIQQKDPEISVYKLLV